MVIILVEGGRCNRTHCVEVEGQRPLRPEVGTLKTLEAAIAWATEQGHPPTHYRKEGSPRLYPIT